MVRFFLVFFLVLFLLASTALAESIRLFTATGSPVANYLELLRTAKEGDQLILQDGTIATVHIRRGRGQRTFVFGIGNGKSLRLLIDPGSAKAKSELRTYQATHSILEAFGAPVPKAYPDLSGGTHLVVEDLGEHITLQELLDNFSKLGASEQQRAKKALLDFGRKMAEFGELPDVVAHQIAWDGTQIKLFDWEELSPNHIVKKVDERSIFTRFSGRISSAISPEFAAELKATVEAERRLLFDNPQLIKNKTIALLSRALAAEDGLLTGTLSARFERQPSVYLSMTDAELEYAVDAAITNGGWSQKEDFSHLEWRNSALYQRLKKHPRFEVWEKALKTPNSGVVSQRHSMLKKHPRVGIDCNLINSLGGR